MSTEFAYIHKDGRVAIKAAHMDIEEIAAEIGYLTHNIYSTLMRQSPPHGEFVPQPDDRYHCNARYPHLGSRRG